MICYAGITRGVKASAEQAVRGDVNADGVCNMLDVIDLCMMKRIVMK